jgi:hypothetical protein
VSVRHVQRRIVRRERTLGWLRHPRSPPFALVSPFRLLRIDSPPLNAHTKQTKKKRVEQTRPHTHCCSAVFFFFFHEHKRR